MLSRTMLALSLAVAVLVAPAAPIEFSKIVSSHHSCCPAMQMNMNHPCQGCPTNSGQTNSSSGCCSAQSPCFNFYANGADEFVAGMASIAFKSLSNDRFTVRSQRPPVPPPRATIS